MNRQLARRGAPIVVIAGLAAVPAIALLGVWQYADAQVPPTTTTTTTTVAPARAPALETDLLSYRRYPEPLAEQAAATESATLQAAQAQVLLDQVPEGSCVRLTHGETIVAERGAGTPVIPASNQKLLVAAVALEVLGADFTFGTELQSPPPVDGVVTGNVYLVGGGDPVLRTADVPDPLPFPAFNTTALEPLADQVVAAGITTIEGDVVGDGSRYDDEFRVDSWGDAIVNTDAGPYDALLVNDGLITNGNYGLEPSRSAARIFFELLRARGVTITGAAANATRPAGLTTIASIDSLPLDDVLVEMLHTSDNNTAEMMVKEIGVAARGEGTRRAGLDTIRATLDGWGVPIAGLELHDGSGLDRGNRVTCETLVAVVGSTPVSDELRDLLPVAGRDGTLADDLLGTPAEGQMQAKTGTLTDVKALSGSQPDRQRQSVEFSVVLNTADADEPAVFEPVWDTLVDVIDNYPVVVEPDVTRFGPL